ncbi:TLD-domain-containing protein [Backusella circina FSU 941]|nr:TLD-domain-containing protein [Backusella circina FSU 941]
MLTLYLPANALSWSDYERTQRKVDHDLQHQLLFSSRKDGTSWQVFVSRLVGQGATLILLKSKDGNVFGGYADEAFESKTDWFGNSSNFLFKTGHESDVWDGVSGTNDHYQYLCWGKKSLPNGFGMGGQFDYAGLWIDADFLHGHSRAGPLCTTYSSPQLTSDQTFLIDEVEVWLVRPLMREDDGMEASGGILSRTEDVEFMEMAGKKMYSKDLGNEPVDEDEE